MLWRRLLAMAIYSYTRESELRALAWSDIDFEHGVIHVVSARDRRSAQASTSGL